MQKKVGVSYKTAWRWYQKGEINGYQAPSGTIIVTEGNDKAMPQKVAIYTRVSASKNRHNLQSQAERLTNVCIAKEVGSGVNDNRQQLQKLLADESFTVIVVEHKDRLTRFGFNHMQTLMEGQGRRYGFAACKE